MLKGFFINTLGNRCSNFHETEISVETGVLHQKGKIKIAGNQQIIHKYVGDE